MTIKINKLSIILLFLLSLLMIGAVSAASDTEDIVKYDITDDTSNHNINNNDVLEKTNTDTVSNVETKTSVNASENTKGNNDKVSSNPTREVLTETHGTLMNYN